MAFSSTNFFPDEESICVSHPYVMTTPIYYWKNNVIIEITCALSQKTLLEYLSYDSHTIALCLCSCSDIWGLLY